MEVHELSNWNQFHEVVRDLERTRRHVPGTENPRSKLLFRGHSDAAWELKTTLERWVPGEVSLKEYYRHVTAILPELETRTGERWQIPKPKEFNSALAGAPGSTHPFPGELYSLFVYLRHHGFPSPLLDWTRSPYIAAYFAFEAPQPREHVAIFAYQEYGDLTKGGLATRPRIFEVGPYVRGHKRHYLQQSQYTVAFENEGSESTYCSHDAAFRASADEEQDLLWKFVLPLTQRTDALRYLHQHNITAHSLFGSEESLMTTLAINRLTIGTV